MWVKSKDHPFPRWHTCLDMWNVMTNYTQKNAWSVTAFDSTDIRSVQDNVSALMPYHLYSLVLIYLIPTASISAVGPSCLFLQTATVCSQHTCIILFRLIQPWQPNRLFQSDTVSSEQSVGDNSLIQLWYHTCIRPEGATGCNRSVAFLRVYIKWEWESMKVGRQEFAWVLFQLWFRFDPVWRRIDPRLSQLIWV